MVRLTRNVRFSLNPGGAPAREGTGFAGKPGLSGFGSFYELIVSLVGDPGDQTGYLVDIKAIDEQVRRVGVPILETASTADPISDPIATMPLLVRALGESLPCDLDSLILNLSPYHSIEMAPKSNTSALIRLRFDFAASHRLHAKGLSDEENRRLFGKCNYENGHGHNYEFEPCVEVALDGAGNASVSPNEIERLAREIILDRYDHRHLNLDTPEFGDSGVNPTVENIARVFYERFKPAIEQIGGSLREVVVRETDRTSATYPA